MSAAPETPVQKQLRIKTSVVTRLEKELTRYQEEKAAQDAKIARMIETGAEEHSVRKQREVLEETLLVIPDTLRRLEKAVDDLKDYVAANATEPSIQDSPGLATAREVIARHASEGAEGAAAEDDAI